MIIAAMHEGGTETRVAITPKAVKSYKKKGLDTAIEHNAGFRAGFFDEAYKEAGHKIAKEHFAMKMKTETNEDSLSD